MKVAIFHDYIGAIGGGERLALTLARGLDADLITTEANPDTLAKMGFEDVNIISLGETLKVAPFKQIHASAKFASCNFPNYNFYIFSGNWAHYAAAKHRPNLWYCHTPVRAFYDMKEYIIEIQKSPSHRSAARLWISAHKYLDKKSIKNINKIVANSENTKRRIKKYHNRNAKVIYPPVATSRFRYSASRFYWLSVNRLYPEKRIPLQVGAFRRMPEERLKIVGGHNQGDHARNCSGFVSRLPNNVEMLGAVSDPELVKLYAECKGLICTAIDEDFGITPVEAMAAGKPVVAVDEGGFRESVQDGVTGRLVAPHVEALIEAVREISEQNGERFKVACQARASHFDEEIFLDRMREEVESVLTRG